MKENKKEDLKKNFIIKIPFSVVEKKMEEDFLELSKNLKIAGFRPGKVPISFVKSKYEKDVKAKVTEKLIQEEGNKEFEKKGYRLAAQPNVKLKSKIEDKVDVEVEYEFEVLPDIALKNFSEIELTKYIADVEEKDINKVVENLFNQYKDYKKVEKNRKTKKGDRLIISYKGYIDEKLFEGGAAEKQSIDLGNNNYFPEFEDNLLEKSINDNVEFIMTFPKDYNKKELKGKKAKFNIIINDILEGIKLKNEDELALKTGSKNSKDLRSKIKNELENYSEDLSFNMLKQTIVSKLKEAYSFQLPDILVSREEEILKNKNIKNENDKKESFKVDIKKEAADKVKIGLIISEIGIKNKINVTEKEIETALARICMQYPGREKEVIEHYKSNSSAMNSLKGPIFEDKVMKFLENKAQVTKKVINSEELLQKLSKGESKNIMKGKNGK
ncbi:MAG: trigger factor [Pelagibacterales bacterium]|nr:trigger factor [Pelagibacterales bacterium]OUU62924.1 MAG: trigger factor [Alphaproteobacteria bacterium TMED62]|tara:strand:+ start:6852 stop:8180 length:1329 start_codon:yes stop_codon:yes gene_type:complete